MNLAVIGIAGAALVTSVVAMRSNECPPEETPRVLLERAITAMDEKQAPTGALLHLELALEALGPDQAGAVQLRLRPSMTEYANAPQGPGPIATELPPAATTWRRFEMQPDVKVEAFKANEMRLEEVLKWMATQAGATPVMRWKQMQESQIVNDEPVTVSVGATDLAKVMAAVNESLGESGEAGPRTIEYRIKDGTIEFAPRSYFDKREAHVVRYDIAGVLESGVEFDELRELITSFVDPEQWADNGGDLAFMKFVGGKLFVKAPPRMQDGVKWYIEQLSSGKPAAQADAEVPQVVKVYPLKHASADDVLRTIMKNEQIKAIDFTSFVVDNRTNSIIGKASAPEHRIVEDAIEALDVERKPEAAAPPPSMPVYVLGAVTRPGPYVMTEGGMTVRRMLSAAGVKEGIKEVAVRRGQVENPEIVGKLTGEDLLDPAGIDLPLQPGDMISVK